MAPILITLSVVGGVFALFFGIYLLVGPDTEVESRLGMVSLPDLGARSESPASRMDRRQPSRGLVAAVSRELNQAGIQMTPSEFLAINAGLTLGAGLLGFVIARNPISGLALGLLAAYLPRVWLRRQIAKRRAAFQDQLPDVLNLVVGSLRAGYGLLQALNLVAQEMPSPSKEEYSRVVQEVSLGYTLPEALQRLVERMESSDLYMVVTAMAIQSEVGGNLGNILETIADTIRDRVKLQGEIRAMTSMQRMTGYMLAAMPFFVAVILLVLNPNYIMQLFVFPWIIIPVIAAINMVIGLVLMNKITQIDF
ncbi:MAG: secretion system protein F [Chloroflexi bacterium]|nr:MAG: secretion system protein F [Chloroflexota bacterium]